MIEQKTVELGRHLVDGTGILDLSEPSPSLNRTDCERFANEYSVSRSRKLIGSESERARYTTCERMHPIETRLEHIVRFSLDWRQLRRQPWHLKTLAHRPNLQQALVGSAVELLGRLDILGEDKPSYSGNRQSLSGN